MVLIRSNVFASFTLAKVLGNLKWRNSAGLGDTCLYPVLGRQRQWDQEFKVQGHVWGQPGLQEIMSKKKEKRKGNIYCLCWFTVSRCQPMVICPTVFELVVVTVALGRGTPRWKWEETLGHAGRGLTSSTGPMVPSPPASPQVGDKVFNTGPSQLYILDPKHKWNKHTSKQTITRHSKGGVRPGECCTWVLH